MAALPSGARLGPYEILAPLGAGGMGDVYRVRDTRLGRTVAIKLLNAELSGDAISRERFEREARSIAALTHPHICTVHDVGDHEGNAFLVMELLEGQTLAARLARTKGGLPLDEALSIATHVAEALAFAHRHHITHRDIKPANIMLTPTGVKLLDFGLAQLRDRDEVTGQSRTRKLVDWTTRCDGHPRLHVARAAGRPRGSAERHFCVWRGVVRDAHGPQGVRRRDLVCGDRRGRPHGSAGGIVAPPGSLPVSRARRAALPREGP